MFIGELLSTIAIGITFFAYLPYIRSILKREVEPHVFSWIIWGISTLVVFFAQLEDHAGIGAWPMGISGLITIGIAILAYCNKSDLRISQMDWFFFLLAISSIPIWFFTTDPLWAVVVLTLVDTLGFAPTVRKVYHNPSSESVSFFLLFAIRNCFAIGALENYSTTTILFPAVMTIACILLIIFIVMRKQKLQNSGSD